MTEDQENKAVMAVLATMLDAKVPLEGLLAHAMDQLTGFQQQEALAAAQESLDAVNRTLKVPKGETTKSVLPKATMLAVVIALNNSLTSSFTTGSPDVH